MIALLVVCGGIPLLATAAIWMSHTDAVRVTPRATGRFLGTGYALAFSSDGTRLLVVSNAEAALYNTASGDILWHRQGEFGSVAAWVRDNSAFVIATTSPESREVQFWQADGSKLLTRQYAYAFTTDVELTKTGYAVFAGGIISTEFGESGAVQLWSLDEQTMEALLCGKLGGPQAEASLSVDLAERGDALMIAVSYEKGRRWEIWDCQVTDQRKCQCNLRTLLPEQDSGQVALSSDGKVLATVTPERFRMYVVEGKELERVVNVDTGLTGGSGFQSVDFSPTDALVATALGDRVEIRSVPDGRLLTAMRDGGRALRFSADGRMIAIAQRDKVTIYDVRLLRGAD